MISSFFLLLALVPHLAIAAPARYDDDGCADIEPRQWRNGGNRPEGGRPAHSNTRVRPIQALAGPTSAPAPQDPAPSSSTKSNTSVQSQPVSASSAGDPPSVGSSAAEPAAPAPSTTGSSASGTSNDGGGGGGGQSGPVGIGWDPLENTGSMDTYVEAGLQWWTNWLPDAPSYPNIEYVPMAHNRDSVAQLKTAMGSWPSGTKTVLSFNEPDQSGDVGGTAMTPVEVVTLHNQAAEILGGDYQLSTPSVARGRGDWLDQWLAACETAGGCKYDIVAYHYYGKDANDLIKYSKDFYAKYNKPLWLTEWACHEFPNSPCNAAQTKEFMTTAIEWFRGEGSSMVVKWAWFGAFQDMSNWHGTDNMDASRIANADGSVNALGKEYLSL